MAMSNIQDLVRELTPTTDTKPKTYTAEVSHTDDEGVVWVRLPGAEQDTPTASTSTDVKMGDTVTVEWRNNRLYIAGNYTNPSAGVERVVTVDRNAQAGIQEAQLTADEALSKANKQVQYFWTDADGAHVTTVPKETFLDNPTGGNTLTDSDGLDVRDGETSLAKFGETTRIGQEEQSRVVIDYHSLQLKDKEGNTYFYVSDLRNENGIASVTDTFIGDGRITGFMLNLTATDNTYSVSVSDGSGGAIGKTTTHVYFASAPTKDAVITVTYSTESADAKAYTLGKRASGTAIGPYSHAEGYNTAASGIHSHAEGTITVASGPQAHAEGNNTRATKYYAHSEGFQTRANGTASHAEGFSAKANGAGAHAEGCETIADGEYSHASGINTQAGYESQTVIGRYNDNQQNNAFEIGNGESENARSNAFEVDWDGNTTAAGNLTVGGHSSPIGTLLTARLASDTSVTKEVATAICSITLPAGTWVVVGYAQFQPNATGVRTMNLHITSGSNFRQVAVPAANGYTVLQTTIVVKIAESTTYYLNVWQNSGTSLTMAAGTSGGYTNGIRAVRIA